MYKTLTQPILRLASLVAQTDSAQALKLYRLSRQGLKQRGKGSGTSEDQAGRGTDPHTVTLVAEIRKCNAMLDFLTQLCEGHNLDSQVRVRRAEE
jgi:hypothetical protein